jgi:predicted permease
MSLRTFFSRMANQSRSWMRAVVGRNRLEAEMDAELACHLENLTADLVRAGHSPAEAARRARVALGPMLMHKEEMRASLGLKWWDELGADLKYGLRILRKSPGFTAIATGSLALAIGANTAIFSIAKSLLYDRLSVPHPGQLRLLSWHGDGNQAVHGMWGEFDDAPEGGMVGTIFSYPVYLELRAQNRSLQDLFAFKEDGMNATVRGEAQRVQAEMVSGNYYASLGVRPQLGRAIQPSDELQFGAGTVAVISDGLWERAFGRSPAVLGQTITLNQSVLTIVGVNPRGFTGAKGADAISPEVYVPITMLPMIDPKGPRSLLEDPDMWWVNVMGRARPGVGDTQAQAVLRSQLEADVRGTMKIQPGETIPNLVLSDGSRGLHEADGMFKKPAAVLMTLTGLVLLLACANIANLLLARSAHRQREMSVRLALGAGRGRVLRQLLTESLLLAAIGGLGGLMLGYAGRNLLPTLMSNAWERNVFAVRFDWGIFAFAVGVTLLTGLLFGIAPAWLAARAEVSSGLKESSQTATRRRRGLAGKFLVGFQIALSTLLVVGAGLFLRTVFALNSVDPGFRTDHLILLDVHPPAKRYAGGKDAELYARLEEGFSGIPGVEQVTAATTPYIAEYMGNESFLPEGEKQDDHKDQAEFFNKVGNGFFGTMGIPIVAGRSFGAEDTATSQRVVVINESLARKRFPNQNPIGKMVKIGWSDKNLARIVGICRDTRYASLREAEPAQFFAHYRQQREVGGITFMIRTRLKPATLASAFRDVVQRQDPDLPIINIRTQQEQIDATMQTERMFAALTTGFGVLALALACVGIYGIMAYTVANRTNEIGIRLALGAQPGQVQGMILRESGWLAGAGVVVGVGAALALTRLVKSMLYGVQPWDPVTLAAGALLLLAVALAASWIPARRAAGVQPMDALRHE